MDASTVGAAAIVLGFATATMAVTDGSFRQIRLPPPPLGVLNLFDVAVMIGMVVAAPYLYLLVPTPLVTVLLVLAISSILHLALEPVATRPIRWVIVLAILGAELVAFWSAGPGTVTFAAVNNLVVCLVAAATANLWAQSGLSAQRAAILAGALTVYDLVFTTFLGVTGDLFDEALDHPFPPLIAWPVAEGDGQVGLGQGDLLFATVFPIIARKAYGARAATMAFASTVAVFVVLLALGITDNLPTTFPVMVVLGPVQIALWLHFHRTYGAERTMAQFRHPVTPTPSPVSSRP